MIKLFNSNTPLVLILLPLIAAGFWLSSFSGGELTPFENSSFIFHWFWIEDPMVNRILALIIITLTGVQLNAIINNNEFLIKTLIYQQCFTLSL